MFGVRIRVYTCLVYVSTKLKKRTKYGELVVRMNLKSKANRINEFHTKIYRILDSKINTKGEKKKKKVVCGVVAFGGFNRFSFFFS